MIREQVFTDMSSYPKVSDTATPIDAVEWFAKNVGITNLDDPSAKVKTILDDVNESELARHEARRARESKAQDEFLDAMFNLDNGTAVLRQKADRTKPAAKQLKVAKKAAKPAKKIARAKPLKKPQAVKPVVKTSKPKALGYKLRHSAKQINASQIELLKQSLVVKKRREAIVETLKSGGSIKPVDWRGKGLRGHQTQSNDLEVIEDKEALNIVRVHQMQTRTLGFMVDNFKRYDMPEPISCYLSSDDREKLFTAIRSNQLVTVQSFKEDTPACRRVMATLSRKYGLNIHSVMKRNNTLGWILLEEAVDAGELEAKRESEISELGDMLQAIDYLRIEKEVAARMPTSTPDEILEAAYREFKRVAKDAGSTISEVLAVKDGQ